MRYNVEIRIPMREVEDIGKDHAIQRATFEAWYLALKETHPERSLVLLSTDIKKYESPLELHAYRILFRFEVDGSSEMQVQWTM